MSKKSSQKPLAIVTGGSSGIGAATCSKLSQQGYAVVNADISSPADNSTADFYQTDITKGEAIDELFATILEKYDKPQVLVCNAGKGIHEKLSEGDPEKWQQVFNLNVMGHLRIIRAFAPQMVEAKQGHVVFISSVSANQPYEWGGIYSASKAALNAIAETLRLEVSPYIKVTVIEPGAVDTNFFKNIFGSSYDADAEQEGVIDAAAVAEAVAFAVEQKEDVAINNLRVRSVYQKF